MRRQPVLLASHTRTVIAHPRLVLAAGQGRLLAIISERLVVVAPVRLGWDVGAVVVVITVGLAVVRHSRRGSSGGSDDSDSGRRSGPAAVAAAAGAAARPSCGHTRHLGGRANCGLTRRASRPKGGLSLPTVVATAVAAVGRWLWPVQSGAPAHPLARATGRRRPPRQRLPQLSSHRRPQLQQVLFHGRDDT
jgi:hypothetical protein